MSESSVCVLMATYNGQAYLREQIDSILHQTYENFELLISDDGSSDSTKYILAEYQNKYPSKIKVVDGPCSGLEANFYELIRKVRGFDLYAFADQDDIWDCSKISRAVRYHDDFPRHLPFVYCSATILVDENSNFIKREKRIDLEHIGLNQALGYNIATGNTIVFSEATRAIFPAAISDIDPLGHDWLTFIYALMFDGNVVYDDFPAVLYRIHASNNSSIKFSFGGRLELLWDWIFREKLRKTNRQMIDSIALVSRQTSPEVKSIIEKFRLVHNGHFFERILAFRSIKITRKSKWTNWINWVAVIFGKF